jgi:hypothetical protein
MHKPRISIRPRFLRKAQEDKHLCLEQRGSGVIHRCDSAGCSAPARAVYQKPGGAIVGWFCEEHMATAGYCNQCGVYIADQPEELTSWVYYGRCRSCTAELFH